MNSIVGGYVFSNFEQLKSEFLIKNLLSWCSDCWCLSQFPHLPNLFKQKRQPKGLIPLCWFKCLVKEDFREYTFPQIRLFKGLALEWNFIWNLNLSFRENFFSQTTQRIIGFTGEWSLKWLLRWLLREKVFLQALQGKGITPLCRSVCLLRLDFRENFFAQTEHENI